MLCKMENYPLSHHINNKNKKRFINSSDKSIKDIVEIILNNIRHVSFENFIKTVNRNVKFMIEKHNLHSHTRYQKPVYIYFPATFINDDEIKENYSTKSNYWLYTYIAKYLKNERIKTKIILSLDSVQNNDDIILMDDCVYTGQQMCRVVIERLYNGNNKKLNFILFVPYMSYDGFYKIHDTFHRNKTLKRCTLSTIDYDVIYKLHEELDDEEIDKAAKMFYYYCPHHTMLDDYAYNEMEKYLIYFDHKLADSASSFPHIFSGMVPNQRNKDVLVELYSLRLVTNIVRRTGATDRIAELETAFEFYPLISNCERYLTKPDELLSTCPVPPYKENYKSFIRKIKNSQEYKSLSFKSSSKESTVQPKTDIESLKRFHEKLQKKQLSPSYHISKKSKHI
jgi:hypothetical protein